MSRWLRNLIIMVLFALLGFWIGGFFLVEDVGAQALSGPSYLFVKNHPTDEPLIVGKIYTVAFGSSEAITLELTTDASVLLLTPVITDSISPSCELTIFSSMVCGPGDHEIRAMITEQVPEVVTFGLFGILEDGTMPHLGGVSYETIRPGEVTVYDIQKITKTMEVYSATFKLINRKAITFEGDVAIYLNIPFQDEGDVPDFEYQDLKVAPGQVIELGFEFRYLPTSGLYTYEFAIEGQDQTQVPIGAHFGHIIPEDEEEEEEEEIPEDSLEKIYIPLLKE